MNTLESKSYQPVWSLDCFARQRAPSAPTEEPISWHGEKDRGWRSAGISDGCDGVRYNADWAPATHRSAAGHSQNRRLS